MKVVGLTDEGWVGGWGDEEEREWTECEWRATPPNRYISYTSSYANDIWPIGLVESWVDTTFGTHFPVWPLVWGGGKSLFITCKLSIEVYWTTIYNYYSQCGAMTGLMMISICNLLLCISQFGLQNEMFGMRQKTVRCCLRPRGGGNGG